ncbi:MAG: methyltransferase domain-containing protein [Pseudomonadota bacterium]|nr:methyltransferase domain-containing protein [Pseudomonadota bacterium]
MFTPDIISLRQFYATPLGMGARELIAAALAELWPQAKDDVALGIGYPVIYLEPYLEQASPVMVCMPAHQGAACWPSARPNLVFLGHESELPLPENSVNRILLVHSVEHSEQLSGMMEEIWRVLTPGGRVLAIVPNRMGFWARSSRSPFGYGRPFSMAQLRDLMTHHRFTLTRCTSALLVPPTRLRLLWRFARQIEEIGRWLWPFLGGVLLVEAEKQLYASIKQPVMRKGYRLPLPAATPAMGMKKSRSV